MSDSTPITQALRGRLTVAALMQGHELSTPLAKGVLAECDNIDALHKALEDENASLRKELKERPVACDSEVMAFVDRLSDAVEKHEDAMADHGWVRLPVDGEAPCKQLGEWIERRGLITGPLDHDGELWHKGDMSASPWGEIEDIVFDGQCWKVRGHDTSAPWLPADSLLHYHAPTVEATLGRGTCKLTRASWDDGTCTWGCICSACDAHLEHETGIGYNFCPICGAKVVPNE